MSLNLGEVGIGYSNNSTVVEFGNSRERKSASLLLVYPYDQQKNVPTACTNYELPNPLITYKNAPRRLGMPISIYVEGSSELKLSSTTLRDSKGKKFLIIL